MAQRIVNPKGQSYGQRINSGRVGNSMTKDEREYLHSLIRRYYYEALSDLQIAERVGVCDRTVRRYRYKNNLPNIYGKQHEESYASTKAS